MFTSLQWYLSCFHSTRRTTNKPSNIRAIFIGPKIWRTVTGFVTGLWGILTREVNTRGLSHYCPYLGITLCTCMLLLQRRNEKRTNDACGKRARHRSGERDEPCVYLRHLVACLLEERWERVDTLLSDLLDKTRFKRYSNRCNSSEPASCENCHLHLNHA